MSFVIDTEGQPDFSCDATKDDSDDDFMFIPLSSVENSAGKSRLTTKSKGNDIDFKDAYLDFSETKHVRSNQTSRDQARQLTDTSKVLSKSILQSGVEKLHSLPCEESRRLLAKKRKIEQEKTAGHNWFNMKAPEITEELRNDLEVLKMRSALDPKQFYKKNDMKVLPKYFQIGRIKESAADFYHSRIPKKDRKKSFVDELLADAEFQRSTKKRYQEIIARHKRTQYKDHLEAKQKKRRKD